MADSDFIFLSDLLSSLSVDELNQLRSTTEERLRLRLGSGAKAVSRNALVNEILDRSAAPCDRDIREAAERMGLLPQESGYHDSNPNNPIKDYNKSIDDRSLDESVRSAIVRMGLVSRGSGYHDTNPNNPFKDYNKSTPGGYHDSLENRRDGAISDPIDRFRELVAGGEIVTHKDLMALTAKLEGISGELAVLRKAVIAGNKNQ